MTDIDVRFMEIESAIDKFDTASKDLDTALADHAPQSVDAGEASDAIATVLFALMEGASTLSTYGQGPSIQAHGALDDFRSLEDAVSEELGAMHAELRGDELR